MSAGMELIVDGSSFRWMQASIYLIDFDPDYCITILVYITKT